MRKLVFIISAIFLTTLCLNGIVFKIMGGFTHHDYYQGDNNIKTKLIPAAGIGIDSDFASEKAMFSLDFWVSYHNQNFNFSGINRYFDMTEINCDLLFKYKFKKYSSPYVFFGAAVSFIIPKKTDANGNKLSGIELKNLWDYGPLVGAGIDIALTDKYTLSIDGRYRFGVAKVKLEDMRIRKNAIFMAVGIKF